MASANISLLRTGSGGKLFLQGNLERWVLKPSNPYSRGRERTPGMAFRAPKLRYLVQRLWFLPFSNTLSPLFVQAKTMALTPVGPPHWCGPHAVLLATLTERSRGCGLYVRVTASVPRNPGREGEHTVEHPERYLTEQFLTKLTLPLSISPPFLF